MPRKRDMIIPLGELAGTLPGLAGRGRVMSAQTRHHFTTLRQRARPAVRPPGSILDALKSLV